MNDCFALIYNMMNQLLNFRTPWGMLYGFVVVSPAIIILMVKGVKKIL